MKPYVMNRPGQTDRTWKTEKPELRRYHDPPKIRGPEMTAADRNGFILSIGRYLPVHNVSGIRLLRRISSGSQAFYGRSYRHLHTILHAMECARSTVSGSGGSL
ncbi:MAG: hypothetical protein ACYC3X_26870 [Pirellulaceae bacterium]